MAKVDKKGNKTFSAGGEGMSLTTVSYEQLQIQPFEIRIHKVALHMAVNDHGKLSFAGVIPEEKEEQYVGP